MSKKNTQTRPCGHCSGTGRQPVHQTAAIVLAAIRDVASAKQDIVISNIFVAYQERAATDGVALVGVNTVHNVLRQLERSKLIAKTDKKVGPKNKARVWRLCK